MISLEFVPATISAPVLPAPARSLPSILVVDDDIAVGRALSRALREDFEVTVVGSADEALESLLGHAFDAVVSDIQMPNTDGIELLRKIRDFDRALPVLFITSTPNLEAAMQAFELSAAAFLPKPVPIDKLRRALIIASRHLTLGPSLSTRRRESSSHTLPSPAAPTDPEDLEVLFGRALERVYVAYQPIVDAESERIVAYEALARCEEKTLANPALLFAAAERLGRVRELGRAIRRRIAHDIEHLEPSCEVFVNLNAAELGDDELLAPSAPLHPFAERVVLEVTERAALQSVRDLEVRLRYLRRLGYRIAVDDLGAGYSGLASLVTLEPDVVKIDMSLVRGIDRSEQKQRIVGSMIELFRALSCRTVLEGIETDAELETLRRLGGRLMQGYRFARPDKPFPGARF